MTFDYTYSKNEMILNNCFIIISNRSKSDGAKKIMKLGGENMYTREEASSVWNGFTKMEIYLKDRLSIFVNSHHIYYIGIDGKKYIDGVSNLLSTNFGHKNHYIIDKITSQFNQLDSCSLFYATSNVSVEYSQRLTNLTNNHFEHVFFTNSGSEAADTSIKIAKQYFYNQGIKGKTKIITLKGSYHGSTIAAGYANGNEYDIRAFGETMESFIQTTPPNILYKPEKMTEEEFLELCKKELEEIVIKEGPDQIAAIMVELVQLSNGVAVLNQSYFMTIKEICNKYNILWIVDEVATGFGRTGKLFACEHLGIWPDIMMLAKSITNGIVPLGAVLVTNNIFKKFLGSANSDKELSHGFTTSGHPIACAAALATLDIIEQDNILGNVQINAKAFLTRMKEFERFAFIRAVQGTGYMVGITFENVNNSFRPDIEIGALIESIMKKFGLIVYFEPNQIFITPPLICSSEELVEIHEIMKKTFSFVDKIVL